MKIEIDNCLKEYSRIGLGIEAGDMARFDKYLLVKLFTYEIWIWLDR